MFEVGINKDYIKLLIDQTYGGEGAEYTGEKDLLEVTKWNILRLDDMETSLFLVHRGRRHHWQPQ